jgi:hypothetical protein
MQQLVPIVHHYLHVLDLVLWIQIFGCIQAVIPLVYPHHTLHITKVLPIKELMQQMTQISS